MARSLNIKAVLFVSAIFLLSSVLSTPAYAKGERPYRDNTNSKVEVTSNIPQAGVVDYGCLGRQSFSTKVLRGHRMFTNALKKKKSLSNNILCMMRNQKKKVTLG